MNPFSVFQRFFAQDLEQRLSAFLVQNRVFQYFAHRTSQQADALARKVGEELAKQTKPPAGGVEGRSGGKLGK